MRRLCLAITLLLISSEAWAQEDHIIGSQCWRTVIVEDVLFDAACKPIYFPVGQYPVTQFHEGLPWKNRLKTDRAVPTRPVTAEAAPK